MRESIGEEEANKLWESSDTLESETSGGGRGRVRKQRWLLWMTLVVAIVAMVVATYSAYGTWVQLHSPIPHVVVTNMPGWRPAPPGGLSGTVGTPASHPIVLRMAVVIMAIAGELAVYLGQRRMPPKASDGDIVA